MNVVCLDMEGVLVPEIWIAFANAVGVPDGAGQAQVRGVFDARRGGRENGGVLFFAPRPESFGIRVGARDEPLLFGCVFSEFYV